MNIKSIKNSILFIAIAIFLVSGNSAVAYVPGVWDPQPRVQTYEPAFYKVPNPYDAPVVTQTTPTTVTNTNNNQNTTTKTTATTTTTKKVATNTNTTNNKLVSTTKADVREIPPVVIDNSANNNGLTALSLAGSGSFMPSSIWQWLIVVFLILMIIILARMLGKSHSHTVHTVAAH